MHNSSLPVDAVSHVQTRYIQSHVTQDTPQALPTDTDCSHTSWHTKKESPHAAQDCYLYSHSNLSNHTIILYACCPASAGSFKSLSKVLFILPSRYFFTVSLSGVFAFVWKLPPTLHSSSKEHDSGKQTP
mmetsp:Transcript_42804/g.99109  ORF Transcript_42804/g.99109 Transcript_42804/m.99109 type:complete len:130 (-) Transcript_42804:2505-2894(-)